MSISRKTAELLGNKMAMNNYSRDEVKEFIKQQYYDDPITESRIMLAYDLRVKDLNIRRGTRETGIPAWLVRLYLHPIN